MKLVPIWKRVLLLLTSTSATLTTPDTPATSYIALLNSTHGQSASAAAPIVNLGYGRYQGYYDSESGLNVFKGIRYAVPPTGKLRWQAPQSPAPSKNKTVIQALVQPPLCPQSGAAQTPEIYGFNSGPGDEDCLFLNVYAPPQAKNLPVLFWIHGGGYGVFGAVYDPSQLMNTNDNGFISVIIQYRLGAFGFLSSEDVKQNGKVNAGLLDQNLALQWVQDHIEKFGGDPKKVTLAGESAGAGAVMLQAMAYGGKQNETLFDNLIAASVYVAKQFNYNDKVPTQYYQAFAEAAGCTGGSNTTNSTIFDCLVSADTAVLQNASGTVSESGDFGTFAFLPVTDGNFVQAAPSKQLLEKAVSGKRLLIGNNANEGVPLTPPTILTANDFLSYVKTTFPSFTATDKSRLLQIYQFDNSNTDLSAPLFDTLGNTGPTALNQSEFATGQKQRAYNLNAEVTFDCPGYWFAEAFSGSGKESWKYQYSITPAYHGADLTAYFSVNATTPTPDLIYAFQKIWGNFIMHNSPVIPTVVASGNATNATVPRGRGDDLHWPTYSNRSSLQMNLNTTGGTVESVFVTSDYSYDLRLDPGVTNDFRLVDANTWEGGRGARCRFWREVAPRVPE
ncbi:MAG: hypothetical protein ASARMPRED_001172 [Alectoria sarmentosa]|nr:MAG: hypothetical protein ASARMPRED_001172 [Alectoria sarmentosa]